MNEFNSDKDFIENYAFIRDNFKTNGWKETRKIMDGRKFSAVFTKDGYAMYVLYGCEEDVKEEIL